MAKEASSANQSLPLQEVLEAEFKALHGERPLGSPPSTDPQNPLKALWIAVHGLEEKRAALCISGGGIRSATFGLGILQGLARCGLLDKFHYLSWIVDAHLDGKHFVLRADEKLTAFLALEAAVRQRNEPEMQLEQMTSPPSLLPAGPDLNPLLAKRPIICSQSA